MNKLRDIKVFNNYTLFECIKSPEWVDYLQDTSKTISINNDLVKLFQSFVNRLSIKDYTVSTFCNVLKNDIKNEDEKRLSNLFEYWKKYESSVELKASEYFYNLLTLNIVYPEYLYFLFGRRYSPKQKANALYELIDLWGDVKRQFFILVFKFIRYSKLKNFEIRKYPRKDLNYIAYEQGSNALWDFIESLKSNCVPCSESNKDRIIVLSLGDQWVNWAKDCEMYPDFVNFISIKSLDNQQRLKVFSYFIKIYLNPKSKYIRIV
jgi:hypothetical protein